MRAHNHGLCLHGTVQNLLAVGAARPAGHSLLSCRGARRLQWFRRRGAFGETGGTLATPTCFKHAVPDKQFSHTKKCGRGAAGTAACPRPRASSATRIAVCNRRGGMPCHFAPAIPLERFAHDHVLFPCGAGNILGLLPGRSRLPSARHSLNTLLTLHSILPWTVLGP